MYELYSSYHRRTLLYTRILQKRKELSRNCQACWAKSKHDISRITAEPHTRVRYTHVLSAYCAKEVHAAAIILS